MREILFRGKRLDNGKWIEGWYYQKPNPLTVDGQPIRHFITDIPPFCAEVNPETVGQYTGLKDKDGNRIFEGDIIAVKFFNSYIERVNWRGKPDAVATVYWDLNSFELDAKNETDIRYADFCDVNDDYTEIVGNIHDTPKEDER